MEPATWGFIGALAGAVVGASASIVTTVISAWNARKLQGNAATMERAERAREFQRGNLLKLQDALSAEMRLIGRAHLEDMNQFSRPGTESRTRLLGEELNQELLVVSRNVAILTERVSDDKLRKDIKNLRSRMNDVLMAQSGPDSLAKMEAVSFTYEAIMEQLGTVLRASY